MNFRKIEKLIKTQDFVQWTRRVHAVIERDDRRLVVLEKLTSQDKFLTDSEK